MQNNVVKETGVETAGTLSHINNEMKQMNLLDPKTQPDIPLVFVGNYV